MSFDLELKGPPRARAGHAGGTTLTVLIEQDVDELSFYCWALGIGPRHIHACPVVPQERSG